MSLARQAFARFNSGDLERFWEMMHPEVVMATDPRWPGGGEYHGVEEFRRFLRQFLEAFGGIRFEETREPERVGDAALLCGRWVGSGVASGIEAESVEFSVVFRERDGLVGECRFYFSEAEARANATGGASSSSSSS